MQLELFDLQLKLFCLQLSRLCLQWGYVCVKAPKRTVSNKAPNLPPAELLEVFLGNCQAANCRN